MSEDRLSKEPASRCAALPYRVRDGAVEVLLVTRKSGSGWIIPKGKIDRALGPRESARLEAREEAGVEGEVDLEPFEEYRHGGDDEPRVLVFLLRVTNELSTWTDAKKRDRAWLPIHAAAQRVSDPGLARVLSAAAPHVASQRSVVAEGAAAAQRSAVAERGPLAGRYPPPPPRQPPRRTLTPMRLGIGVLAAVAVLSLAAWALLARKGGDGDGHNAIGAVAKGAKDDRASDDTVAASDSICRVQAAGVALSGEVSEASGIAAGRGSPDVLWTHNDSGEPVLYAFAADGSALGRVRVTGASVEDWEDVAAGPCPGGSCLYLADIGDNAASRASATVYRVPEPAPADTQTAAAEAFHATYPDGRHDAEAMFVLPDSAIYIVTKGETGPVAVYRFPQPLRAGATVRLERVAELRAATARRRDRITGASASPDGRWVALRTLETVDIFRTEDLLAGRVENPIHVDLAGLHETQGEGVGWGPAGALYLSSEGGKKNTPGTLSRLTCTPGR